MLHVVLLILKIIGIILLSILGLLLLLILLVLFVPIRYRAQGEKNADKMWACVKVTYLLHILSVKFVYPEPGSVVARVFGIRIFDTGPLFGGGEDGQEDEPEKPKKQKKKKEKKRKKEKADKSVMPAGKDVSKEPVFQEYYEISGKETAEAEEKTGESVESAGAETADGEVSGNEEKISPLKHPVRWIKEKIQRILYTIRNICDKIKHIADTIQYYREVVTASDNVRFYKRVKQRVLKVLKSIRPRVLKADMLVGTGSPDTTGYVCALCGMLSPALGRHVNLVPNFEDKQFEGRFFLKGRITIFTILIQGLKVAFDKQLRILLKQLKREEA